MESQSATSRESELLAVAESQQVLIEPDAFQELVALENAEGLLNQAASVIKGRGQYVVSHVLVADLVASLQTQKKALPVTVEASTRFDAPAKRMEARIRIFKDREVTNKSRCTGTLDDFVAHFNNRFTQMKGILRGRRTEYTFVETIQKAAAFTAKEKIRVVGMVYQKKTTKNGHVLIELEDDTHAMPCLVSANSPLFAEAQGLLEDEVVALDGFLSKELFIVDRIVWPDVPIREKKRGDNDVAIGFLSDLHVGSKYFLQNEFYKLLEFLNGKGTTEEQEVAGKIKYLFIAGDLVDGIGVYPTQENQLVTKDIYEQYRQFVALIKQIPEHIHVIIGPGNHDAVRTAEPQPQLFDEFAMDLLDQSNVHLVGNPAWFEVEGFKVLMYHGTSLDSLISSLNAKDGYNHPEKMGIELLKRRHLAPTYGDKPLVPEHQDYMVVSDAPDIFHFGHVHKNGYADYRGTFVINAGTWQDTTDFQKRIGHQPTPCRFPVYFLKTGSLQVLHFGGFAP
ncbi:DNA-directed DNA polymerase II small subunit [Candidatus Micrarchaeota archaeon]|nr:DNA-directed DNA polymerase II small subunit [Candidatus Micrarchaeota archaeon]